MDSPGRSPFFAGNGSGGSTGALEARAGGTGDGVGGARVYAGRGAGGKLRSSRRGSSMKTTPYDRPASGRHATARGATSSSSSSSIASRVVDSASRLISSSASFFFSSFFGRKTLAIKDGNLRPEEGVIAEEQDEKDDVESPVKQDIQQGALQDEKDDTSFDFDQGQALVSSHAGVDKKRLDIAHVEEILKQKTWSREQVNRLTDLLQTRVNETTTTTARGVGTADRAVETSPRAVETTAATPISEAQRWREELKKARSDCMPVEVARAYMGERTSSPSGLTLFCRGTAHQIDRVAELQPPPGLGLLDDRYRAFPILRSSTRSSTARVPKRSSLLDEEWMSVGAVRRTRQKTFQLVNSSPYTRGMVAGEDAPPGTYASLPTQTSQTARKILDTLEKLTPSPKGKSLDEDFKAVTESTPRTLSPNIYNIQARKSMQITEFPRFSNLREPSTSNGKLDFGSTAKSPANLPTLTFGTVKESNSEEKSQVNLRLPSSSEAGFPSLFPGASKFSAVPMAISLPCTAAANASVTSLSHSTPISSVSPAAMPLPAAGSYSQNVSSSAAVASIQPESKGLFSWSCDLNFSFPSATTENRWTTSSAPPGGSLAVDAWSTRVSTPATVALPAVCTIPATDVLSTAPAPSLISPAREEHSEGEKGVATEGQVITKVPEGSTMGLDNIVKEPDKFSNVRGLNPFKLGSPSSGTTFSFRTGSNSSPFSTMGAQPAAGQDFFPFGAQSVTPASSSSSFSVHSVPFMGLGSSPASVSAPSSFPVMTAAASSTHPTVLLGVQSNPLPSFKPSSAGQLFGASQISKPTVIPSLTKEASNTSFSFSPSPAPVMCETSTFPLGSSANAHLASSSPTAGQVSAFNAHSTASEASSSSLSGASNSVPVFPFTSPSGGPKLPAFGSDDALFPAPTFTFGSGDLRLSSSTTSLSIVGQTGSSSLPGQLFGSVPGSASGPFSAAGVPSSPPQAGLEFASGFTSGASGSEKSGRKFFKAKRRK